VLRNALRKGASFGWMIPSSGVKIIALEICVFIQRDYSEGTSVKFHTRLPTELEGMVSVPSVSPGITINIYLHSRTD